MNHLWKGLCAACLLGLGWALPLVAADYTKPLAVISVSSINELIGDVGYLTASAGQDFAGKAAAQQISAYTQGVDKTKPIGVLLVGDGENFGGMGFIPVTDIKALLGGLKEQFGEAKEAAGGIWELPDAPQPVFIKEQGGYAFLSNSAAELGDLPKDPVALLGGAEKEYDIAVRFNVQNMPESLKKMIVNQISSAAELGAADAPGFSKARLERMVTQVETALNETEAMSLGWKVDSKAKHAFLEVVTTAVAGTKSAKEAALLVESATAFGGLLDPNSGLNFHISTKTNPSDPDAAEAIKTGREQFDKEIANSEDLTDDQKKVAKEIMGTIADVIEKTIASGKLDGGLTVVLNGKSLQIMAGGFVADGPALEGAVKKLADLLKDEPDAPQLKFDADKHGDVRFHTAKIPIPEPDAQKVFGAETDFAIGIGPKSFYFGFGNDAVAALKKVIDGSAAKAPTVSPVQFVVSLAPMLRFASVMEENLKPLGALADKAAGNDKIMMYVKPVPRGAAFRIEVQEGAISALGAAAELAPGGF